MNIAIWGGTGHVGQALFHAFSARGFACRCYVRNAQKAEKCLPAGSFRGFEGFPSQKYDMLVNCIAAGAVEDRFLFETLEEWDWRMIGYAKENPACVCVSISSGSAYGCDFAVPANEDAVLAINPDRVEKKQVYGLVKLMCEQRHRAFYDLPLVDVRLFAFFTRYMDVEQPFFMSDLVKAVRKKETLVTQAVDFYRDFAHPEDFADLLCLCVKKKRNAAYDLYSKAPVKKSEILATFAERHKLRYSYGEAWRSLTGGKAHYYSNNRRAAELGYEPRFSSLDVLLDEAEFLVHGGENPDG